MLEPKGRNRLERNSLAAGLGKVGLWRKYMSFKYIKISIIVKFSLSNSSIVFFSFFFFSFSFLQDNFSSFCLHLLFQIKGKKMRPAKSFYENGLTLFILDLYS